MTPRPLARETSGRLSEARVSMFRLSRRSVLTGAVGATLLGAQASAAPRGHTGFSLSRVDLVLPDLDPAHHGTKVAQLSDIHVGSATPDERILSAVRTVNSAEPDLVVLTGDYVTHFLDPRDHVAPLLRGLRAPAYAVLGNHDHRVDAKYLRAALESNGYVVLQNEHTVAQVKGAPFTVIGVDDGGTRHDDVGAAFKGLTRGGSRLVLAHSPPTAKKLPPDEGLLCVSGHTHGGQIRVGGLTDALFARAGQPFVRGLYEVGGNQLYVNRGLGFGRGGSFPRFGSEPEVTLFTLLAPSALTVGMK